MNMFALDEMTAHPYEEREKNVFYQAKEFKTRVIELPPGGRIPLCEMAEHVIFYVLNGEAKLSVNSEVVVLKEKQCLITGPAKISMRTERGAKLMGIQIAKSIEH